MVVNNNNDIQVKMEDGWMISIRFTPWSDNVDVWIANKTRDNTYIYHFDKTGTMVEKKLKEGELEIEPSMRFNRRVWEGIQRAMQGIEETPEKQSVDAELKATKYHLEDLRKLTKLK
jgi:hypothetical protein